MSIETPQTVSIYSQRFIKGRQIEFVIHQSQFNPREITAPAYCVCDSPSYVVKTSEDFLERPGEPIARFLRAFNGLITDILTLVRCLCAYILRLFGGHFRTLDGRVLYIFSLVTDVFRLLYSDLRTLYRRILYVSSLVNDFTSHIFRLFAGSLYTLDRLRIFSLVSRLFCGALVLRAVFPARELGPLLLSEGQAHRILPLNAYAY